MMEKERKYLKIFFSTLYLSAFTFGGGYVIVTLLKRKFVVLQSLRPAVVAMIFSAGLAILLPTLFSNGTISFLAGNFQVRAALLFAGALVCLRVWKLNPILVMAACGFAELIFQLL